MISQLDKFKFSIDKLSSKEIEELTNIHNLSQKYIVKQRYEEAIALLKNKLIQYNDTCGLSFINTLKFEIVKAYNEYILHLINAPGRSLKNIGQIKVLFNECDNFIGNNIKSYLLKQNNYACFLSQNGHSKQALKLQTKILKIDILNYLYNSLNNESLCNNIFDNILDNVDKDSNISVISKDYANISSLNNNLKNNYNSLIESMQGLALSQFDRIFNGNCDLKTNNDNLCFNYYSLGAQQEFLRRNSDALCSFNNAKLFASGNKGPDYSFIKKIKINHEKMNEINFRECLNLNNGK